MIFKVENLEVFFFSSSSNLAMVFSKLPELLAQTKHQLDSTSTSSDHNMATAAAAATDHYISCIKINGVPILPPVVSKLFILTMLFFFSLTNQILTLLQFFVSFAIIRVDNVIF